MGYKVFISHSVSPQELAAVYTVAEEAAKRGITPFIADRRWDPKGPIPDRLLQQLNDSDAVLVIGTQFGPYAAWLNREVQEAYALGKQELLLVLDPEVADPQWEPQTVLLNRQDFAKTVEDVARRLETMRERKALTWLVVGGLLLLLLTSKD